MSKRKRSRDTWRKYLKGDCPAVDETKMRHDIRERAKNLMSDLKLICEKASERDKILIFRDPETMQNLVIPLIRELMNTSKMSRESKEITGLASSLKKEGIAYDLSLLVRSAKYREKKKVELFRKWGFSRKNAVKIASGEIRKEYPHLLRYP